MDRSREQSRHCIRRIGEDGLRETYIKLTKQTRSEQACGRSFLFAFM